MRDKSAHLQRKTADEADLAALRGDETDLAALRGDMTTVYKLTKKLCGKITSQTAPVNDKQDNFREVLNRPKSDEGGNPPPVDDIVNIDSSQSVEAEIKGSIRAMKSGKAAVIDCISLRLRLIH